MGAKPMNKANAKIAIKAVCRRCYHDLIITFPSAESFEQADVHACPGCMGTETYDNGDPKPRDFPGGYDLRGYKVTSEFVDPIDTPFDALSDDVLTHTQADDFFAVVADGKTGGERARERGVARGTVGKNVDRARRKIRGEA